MTYAEKFTNAQRQIAYKQGQKVHGKQVAKQQAQVRKNRSTEGADTSKGKVHFDGDRTKLNKIQRASLDAMEVLAKALGVQIYVFESEVDENGNHVGANGWYDPSDGSIHIDLYAGNSGKGTMLFTVAHELAHFIKQWSPSRFERLANFLTKQYTAQGQSISELVEAQQDKAARNGRELDYDAAYEEMVADSMESMLADGSIIEMMAELKQQDKGLWQKIKDWFKDLAGKIQAVVDAYKGVEPDSTEGRMVADMKDMIGTLQALYMDALVDASENFDGGVQKITALVGGDVRYCVRDGSITTESTEEERYEILKDAEVTLAEVDRKAIQDVDLESYNTRKKSAVTPGFKALAKQLNILNVDLENSKISFPFQFSGRNLEKSLHHQLEYGGTYQDYVKAMSCFTDIVRNAIPIELHPEKKVGTARENPDLLQTYVLVGAYKDGKSIVPVQLEVKEFRQRGKSLYMTVMLTKIDLEVVDTGVPGETGNVPHLFSRSTISLRQLFENVNIKDGRFLKYVPDGFLSTEQKTAKQEALRRQQEEYAGYGTKKLSDRDSVGNQLSEEQQEYFRASKERDNQGRLRVMYRGDSTEVTVFDRKKSSYSNLYGRGFYFTSSASHAGQYGQATAYYLNITNPVSTTDCTITKEQMQKFLEAVAENEDDYSFENYGYGATIESVLESVFTGKSDFAMLYDVSQTAIGDMVEAVELFNKINGTNYDGFILDTETVIFNSAQAKRTDNHNPTPNPDTRYSRRDVGRQEAVTQALEKENAKLREDVAELRELVSLQRQVTNGTKFTKTSVEAAAISLKQSANAKGDTKGFAKLLNGLYEYIASTKELTWEGVKEQAQGAVDWLWEHIDRRGKRGDYAWENNCHGGSLAAYR